MKILRYAILVTVLIFAATAVNADDTPLHKLLKQADEIEGNCLLYLMTLDTVSPKRGKFIVAMLGRMSACDVAKRMNVPQSTQ